MVDNLEKLDIEISGSGHVNTFTGLSKNGDVLEVMGTSLSNEASLDTLILNHVIEVTDTTRINDLVDSGVLPKGFKSINYSYSHCAFRRRYAAYECSHMQ